MIFGLWHLGFCSLKYISAHGYSRFKIDVKQIFDSGDVYENLKYSPGTDFFIKVCSFFVWITSTKLRQIWVNI